MDGCWSSVKQPALIKVFRSFEHSVQYKVVSWYMDGDETG